MGSKKAYWFYQIAGWSIYFISDILNYFTLYPFGFDELNHLMGNVMVNVATGVSLTHIFRLIFKHYHWIKLPIGQLILRCLIVVFLITFILAAINIPMDRAFININSMNAALLDISYHINLTKPVFMWVLVYVFYSFANESRVKDIEKVKLESSVKESEAKVLRAQMNPHFVFNALNSIRALVLEEPNKAMNGITQLSNLLRSSLISNRKTTVSLKEELKTIEDYLSLEKIRYEERLQTKCDIAPQTLGIQVPPMMLQTLVENAIKHGVQKALRWGFIEIKTYIENGMLVIVIRNTGQLHAEKSLNESSGFGIENTKRRLQLLYGNDYQFKIFQEDKLTVRAEIHLPIENKVI
ncbi:histidine kinase [Marinilongibacter aquaticus]|uniref:sensor histidine kinase n=1 Tax=Marinilongibacter aquaticus TaxID=2975157 RepID=UPI0021BD37DF|nr:histidine kinase [Marinilongibacter aquaticus]UBM60256.1 histidine kinase [Marinilongibacter aquaticus]